MSPTTKEALRDLLAQYENETRTKILEAEGEAYFIVYEQKPRQPPATRPHGDFKSGRGGSMAYRREMSVPTGAGNYPAGVTDNDPHFNLPGRRRRQRRKFFYPVLALRPTDDI